MNLKNVVEIATTIGEMLLSSGAEIYRVEESMSRIAKSYGYEFESFVMPTGFSATAKNIKGEVITCVKRIKNRTVDLHRIEYLNDLSRRIESDKPGYEEVLKEIEKINNIPYFKYWLRILSSGLVALSFTLLFNGNIIDAIIAFIITCAIYITKNSISKLGFFQFLEYFISGFLAAMLSLILKNFIYSIHVDKVIIGSIMILVPGIAMTNAIKDALYGDIISSFARFGEALFIAAAVGAGVGFALTLGIGWVIG
ncbi:Inner membrane protein YjjP [Caloramator mitchellensis]|uniref:Inner membrane protein YjjP n=1 Tax=Caloramator mitchellensis TaxID=908809 RepID=A0A0R3K2P9_CALMK|nr:threonine/serine exporter family protein [Caloramator mitchellensis]KRQ87202.1 Inner membrane protein YjjP [Caloramator mitchellensis]